MNPLTQMEDDINNLRKASEQLFNQWNDSKSEQFRIKNTEEILKLWDSYDYEIKTLMSFYRSAEKEIMNLVKGAKKI
jgi:hypothetical protein